MYVGVLCIYVHVHVCVYNNYYVQICIYCAYYVCVIAYLCMCIIMYSICRASAASKPAKLFGYYNVYLSWALTPANVHVQKLRK